jgi:pimeloyl-ACP methyl ester carboxylesterase
MKRAILFIMTSMALFTTQGKDLNGYWSGVLRRPNTNPLRICFKITQTNDGLKTSMNMPDQGLKHFAMSSTTFDSITVKIVSNEAKISYEGTYLEAGKKDSNTTDSLLGYFNEGGKHYPINIGKGIPDTLVRPQEPKPPFSYHIEDVMFENKKDKISLAGTLTLPKKSGLFPVVILISGSGPHNRNEEMYGHKPFLVIADNLAKNGIGCLRFDDRGTGQSGGDYKTASSEDFKEDVEAALNFLQSRPTVDKSAIGLIGHNEGAIIAQLTAASRTKEIKFIILLNAAGIPCDKLQLMQNELLGKASGMDDKTLKKNYTLYRGAYDIVMKNNTPDKLKSKLTTYMTQALGDTTKKVVDLADGKVDSIALKKAKADSIQLAHFIDNQVNELSSAWMQHYLKYDPAKTLEKIKCKVLVYNGEKDLQVPGKTNIEAIVAALQKGGNTSYDTKLYPSTNHLLQSCKTGTPQEYERIEQTIAPQMLSEMTKWLVETNDVQAYMTNRNNNTSSR